jgi:hypothetical protein
MSVSPSFIPSERRESRHLHLAAVGHLLAIDKEGIEPPGPWNWMLLASQMLTDDREGAEAQ